jgi:hypothetical protein
MKSARTITSRSTRELALSALQLQGEINKPHRDAWKTTIGMFTDDPVMDEVFENALKYRASLKEP